jgi:hypothetical protein
LDSSRRTRLLLLLVSTLAAPTWSCASRPPAFRPAGAEDARRALGAWENALARADSLPAVRLLYDARLSEGLVKFPGTLAVNAQRDRLEATLTGPFGSQLAHYASGILEGKGLHPIPLDAEELRAVLAGVWRATPQVAGARGDRVLMRFPGAERVEGVLDVTEARLESLHISRPEADLVATYAGVRDPWPERITLEDRRSGRRVQLTLVGKEPADPAPTSP